MNFHNKVAVQNDVKKESHLPFDLRVSVILPFPNMDCLETKLFLHIPKVSL